MSELRKRACEGDLLVGIAGKSPQGLGRISPQLIYWMKVSDTATFDEYWDNPAFDKKRPVLGAAKIYAAGDRIYRRDRDTGEWLPEPSLHHIPDSPQPNGGHLAKDTKVDRVLVAEEFTYWGNSGPKLPDYLRHMFFSSRRSYQVNHDPQDLAELYEIIGLDKPQGRVGEPTDWDNSKYFSQVAS